MVVMIGRQDYLSPLRSPTTATAHLSKRVSSMDSQPGSLRATALASKKMGVSEAEERMVEGEEATGVLFDDACF